MSTTSTTAITALRSALRDPSGAFMADADYEAVLLSVAAPQATYPARRLMPGYWSVPSAPLCLFGASFDEQPGASYELHCGGGSAGGVSIKLTAGTDLRDSIDITGCALDYPEALARLLEELALHRAQDYAQSLGLSSSDPQTAMDKLLQMASVVRGVKAV